MIRLQCTTMRSPSSGSSKVGYFPVIAWTTADGRPMETDDRVVRELHHSPPPGTPVTVYYDPADPSRWMVPSTAALVYWLLGGIGAVFAVAGVGILLAMVFWGSSMEKCDSGPSGYSTSCP